MRGVKRSFSERAASMPVAIFFITIRSCAMRVVLYLSA
jgi:hypothetical protein